MHRSLIHRNQGLGRHSSVLSWRPSSSLSKIGKPFTRMHRTLKSGRAAICMDIVAGIATSGL
jgi:hypothetical protein